MSIYEIKNNHIVIKLLFIKFSILILDWHVTVFFFLVRLIDIFYHLQTQRKIMK